MPSRMRCILYENIFQVGNQHHGIQGAGEPHNFKDGLTSYGTQSASQFGAQMYGYGTNFNNASQTQQFYVNQKQDVSKKRKRDDVDGDEMGEVKYLERHIYGLFMRIIINGGQTYWDI